MKSIISATLLTTILSVNVVYAQADKWLPLSNAMYVMPTKDNDRIMLSAGIDPRDHEVAFRVLDMTGSVCEDGESSEPVTLPPYKINNRYIKIKSICLNGSQLVVPETPEGRKYLYDQIMSDKEVTIETNMVTPILHFKGALPQLLIKRLKEANNAM